MAKSQFIVETKKVLTVIFGETGMGKSSLARLLHQKFLDRGLNSVLLTNPNYPTPNALLRTIIQEFQLPRTSRSYKDNLDLFKAYLYDQALEQGKTVVLIIDEAQTLRFPLLELLRQLINYETNEQKLLQMVLFAQDELRVKLAHARGRSFRSRIAMASALDRLGLEETRKMIVFRWQVASGGAPQKLYRLDLCLLGLLVPLAGALRMRLLHVSQRRQVVDAGVPTLDIVVAHAPIDNLCKLG